MVTMDRELRRIRCVNEDGDMVVLVERQYYDRRSTAAGDREYPGARRVETLGGMSVRLIDATTYEVPETGELLRGAGD